MLATADDGGGLPGHVNGFAQLVLFTFMSGIQIALIFQEWFLCGTLSYAQIVHIERYELVKCSTNDADHYSFMYKLSYAMVLLLLQNFISPFIVKSSRNYREGLLFCIGSIFLLIIWIGWITMYVKMADYFGPHWRDISICCGLVACPTSLLLVIFIPKVQTFSIRLIIINNLFHRYSRQ